MRFFPFASLSVRMTKKHICGVLGQPDLLLFRATKRNKIFQTINNNLAIAFEFAVSFVKDGSS